MSVKPVIGMIAAANPKLLAGRHLINTSYVRAVIAAGGTPLLIPADEHPERAEEYMPLLHGLLVPGGEDVTPALYGEDPVPQVTYVNEDKDRTEMALACLAAERGIPIFGICRGMQLLNVCFGGTLYQDLPSQHPAPWATPRIWPSGSQLTHRVKLESGSLLERLLGEEPLSVNSYHHQAVRTPAPGVHRHRHGRPTAWWRGWRPLAGTSTPSSGTRRIWWSATPVSGRCSAIWWSRRSGSRSAERSKPKWKN